VYLAEIWRYPVKSMAGELLAQAELGAMGVPGDRGYYVVNGRDEIVTARNRPRLLAHRATLDAAGQLLVDGLPWHDEEIARRVSEAAGTGALLVPAEGVERFDILPLLVATDGAVAALGSDRRRLRPNLLIGGVEGLAERAWEGRFLRIGSAVIGLATLRGRCIMTTFDPDTLAQDVDVLRDIQRRFGGTMALNAWTAQAGSVAVGDAVELLDEFAAATEPTLGRLAG